jgi:structural maintenance of chromosomes protein 5
MVIGANGVGKSTVLNAICLGLGGDPKLLGRADDIRSFVRHGCTTASIEITVAPHPNVESPHVFRRVLDSSAGGKKGGSSICYINGQKVSVRQLRDVVRGTYQIAIDNLCTFLPQDKVGSFSGFSDTMRLLETEKTFYAGEHQEPAFYYNLHMELIQAQEDLQSAAGNVETVRDQLTKLQHEKNQLQREKERLEEREKVMQLADLYRKKQLWLQFDLYREQTIECKEKKDSMREAVKAARETLRPLEEDHVRLCTLRKKYEAQVTQLDASTVRSKKEMEKQVEKYENHDNAIEQILSDLQLLETQRSQMEKELQKAQEALAHYEETAQGNPPEQDIERDWTESQAATRRARHDYEQARRELRSSTETLHGLEERAAQSQQKLAKLSDGATQRQQRIFRMNPTLAKISSWIDANRTEFRRPVHGPIVCTVNTKSHNTSAYLEFHVPNRILNAYVVETEEDYQMLYKTMREKNIPINVVKVQHKPLSRPYSEHKLHILKEQHGVMGYLDESFTAPQPVMQALRDYAMVEKVLVGGEATQTSIDEQDLLAFLNQPDPQAADPKKQQNAVIFSSKGKKSFRFTVSKSRYAANTNIRQDEVSPAKMLAPGVSPKIIQDEEEKLAAVHEELNAFRPSMQEIQQRVTEFESVTQDAALKAQHAKKMKENWIKFQSKLTRARQKLEDCEEELRKDDVGKKKHLVSELFNRMSSSISALTSHKDERRRMIETTISLSGVTLNKSVAAAGERDAR